jgi:glutathione S-transferase
MNKPLRLWSFADVDRSGKVRWTAAELGYPVEEQRLKLGEHAADDYRRLNPYAQIPAAEVDGQTWIESGAICILLAERKPESGLIPTDLAARERFWQSMFLSNSTLEAPAVSYYLSRSGVIDSTWAELWEKPLRQRLNVFAGEVPADGHICGDFSLADICAAYVLRIGVQAQLLQPEGGLRSYLERLMDRPAAREARFFERLEL